MDRLLAIGVSGLVGSKVAVLSEKHGFEAHGTTNSRRTSLPRTRQLDITDRDATVRTIREVEPAVVVNTAAVTNVDYCETHRENAHRINVEGVGNLVDAVRGSDTRLIQISTDYVFDGAYGHYSEEDTPSPVNVYGQTKLDAEKIVEQLSNYAIARPSVIYGWNPPETGGIAPDLLKPMNFAMFVADKLKKGETVRAVRDQYSSPTFADNLAEGILRLAKLHVSGVFHTAGKSCLSRYEFAVKVAEVFGYSIKLIQPVFSSDFKQLAVRPKYSCLHVDKAERLLEMRFLTAEQGLREMRNQSPATDWATGIKDR